MYSNLMKCTMKMYYTGIYIFMYTACINLMSDMKLMNSFVMKPLWYLGFILVLERFSVFIFQDLRVFQQLEFN